MNGSENGVCELVVSGGDSAEGFQLVEETPDAISFAVQGEVGVAGDQPIPRGGDDSDDATLTKAAITASPS